MISRFCESFAVIKNLYAQIPERNLNLDLPKCILSLASSQQYAVVN
jgi:hypothetical protein